MTLQIKKEATSITIDYESGNVSVLTKELLIETDTNDIVKELDTNRTSYMPAEHRKPALLEALESNVDARQIIDNFWTVKYMESKKVAEDDDA